MKYIDKTYTKILEVKQSKFIAHLVPYNLYDETLERLKLEHPKARHYVVAFRYLNEFNQIVEHSSDDGEPKGTSGKPSLFVLQGSNLINSAVIIVRYFGGTKLGTGGLVRAYSDSVNLVLEDANLLDYVDEKVIDISVEYTNTRLVDYECDIFNIKILDKIFSENVVYKLKGSESNFSGFFSKVGRITVKN